MADFGRVQLIVCFGGYVKYGSFDTRFGKYMRLLPLLLAILLFASTSSAASLCVDGDTLQNYINAGSCYVNAGLGVNLLFTFNPGSFTYSSDGTENVFATDIIMSPVTGPGSPEAGLKFSTGNFTVPGDGTNADINVFFDVTIYNQPSAFQYMLSSAHFAINDLRGTGAVFAEESEASQTFNLAINDPPGTPTPDATYPLVGLVEPTTDIFIRPNAQVFNWTTSFDLTNAPEPGSFLLIPGGLVLLGLFRAKRFAKSALPLIALLTLFAAKSHANALCTDLAAINGGPVVGTSLGMDKFISYSSANGGCIINDMLFDFQSFTVTGGSTGSPLASAATTKLLFIFNNNTGSATDTVQLRYVPVATTAPTEDQTFSFQYTVTAPLYQVVQMQGSTTATAGTIRTTTITPNTAPAATGSPVVGLGPLITFNNPLNTTFSVNESFHLPASTDGLHISGITETYTEVVPEPVTSLLMGSSLLGLGFLSRKRKA